VSQYPAVIDLATLNGTDGFRVDGAGTFAHLGVSVSSLGDINRDGFDDVLIGAPFTTIGGIGTSVGAAYVVYGAASGFASHFGVTALDGSNGFALTGPSASGTLGYDVAGVGDVNGDGIDDFASTAQGLATSYVIFGQASGFTASAGVTAISDGFTIDAGRSIAGAGDINGDGYADILVGSTTANYVVFGRASGGDVLHASLNGSNGFSLTGTPGGPFAFAGAHDVNGDGIDDILLGCQQSSVNGASSGESFVLFGTQSGFAASVDLSALDGADGFSLRGEAAGDQAGSSVSSAGDVNGDGIADLLIGADGATPHGYLTGAAYVVFGANSFAAHVELSSLDGSNGFKISGSASLDYAGCSVASAGDVNGDGFDDVLIGAYYAHGDAIASGAAYVVFGKASGFAANIDLGTLDGSDGFKLSGVRGHDRAGSSVSGAGDVNGDGLDDIVIGAHETPNAGSFSGSAYVVLGRQPDAAVDRTGTDASQSLAGGAFDDRLAGLGGNDRLNGNAGNDTIFGGDGNDVIHGGLGNDHIDGGKGQDQIFGDDGDDTIAMGKLLRATDSVDGGDGYDTLKLSGDYSFGLRLDADTVTNVEAIALRAGYSYELHFQDGNLGAGQVLRVTGAALGAADTVWLDGSRESDGAYAFTGGAGNDHLEGGAMADTLRGGGGSDVLTGGQGIDTLSGGAGADTFVYRAAVDSAGTAADRIADFDGDSDHVDLWFSVQAIDATQTAASRAALGSVLDAAHLGAGDAAVAQIGAHTYLVVDANGVAGYQDGQDMLIRVDGMTGTLDTGDFV